MKFLVTGGAGFIGSHFLDRVLFETNVERVVTLDKLTYAGNRDNLPIDKRHQLVVGDICDRSLVRKLFEEVKPDVIVHLAAETHVDRSIVGPDDFIQTNVVGTFTLLDEARRLSKQPLFLHVSTDEVFGSLEANDPPFNESTPYNPSSPYAASKASADHLVRAYSRTYDLKTIITNCSNNFGPRQYAEKLIPVCITKALKKEPIPVYSNGQNVRDWLYVGDHAKALLQLVRSSASLPPSPAYCIGGRNERSNIEVVRSICSILDELRPTATPYESLIEFVTDRPGHDWRYAIDPSKIERDIGWCAYCSFDVALRSTVEWYLQ